MFVQHNLLTITWSMIIVVLCCIPGKEFPEASFLKIPHLDKIVHFVFHFVLVILSAKQFKVSFLSRKYFISAFIYSFTLGLLIEVVQHYFIPFRDGNLLDVFANILGSVLGLVFVYYKLLPNYFLVEDYLVNKSEQE